MYARACLTFVSCYSFKAETVNPSTVYYALMNCINERLAASFVVIVHAMGNVSEHVL